MDISLWLVPEKTQEETLQKEINYLSQRYGAFPFIPHITAYYLGRTTPLEQVLEGVKKGMQGIKPFTLSAEGIFSSDMFTKTLYVQYALSPELQNLYSKLKSSFYATSPYTISPHLSLIYKNNMREEDKVKEKARIEYPKLLILDKLLVITKKGGIITKDEDVKEWEITAPFSLGS